MIVIEKKLDKLNRCKWSFDRIHKKSKICIIPKLPILNTWKIPNDENLDPRTVLEKDAMDDINFSDEIVEEDTRKFPKGTTGVFQIC